MLNYLLLGFAGGFLSGLLGSRFTGGLRASLGRFLFGNLGGLDGLNEHFTLTLQSFDDFLFLNEESTNDTFAQTAMAENTTVGTGDCLLTLGQTATFAGATGADTLQLLFTLTALWDSLVLLNVLVYQTTTRGADTKI